MDTKVCNTCERPRPVRMFYRYRSVCKVCVLTAAKAYREANHARVRALERQREQTPKYRSAHVARNRAARAEAKRGSAA